ncbi:MupG family TIM beta-alpha barrel fold protein [Virgibacillus sp. LDC-1]|uniref:DUF871 domain-containing protein n=1 Tax=Virgibacillus sp. LDC-1 TaxID=3039856 RepID=UPI0024DDFFAC|nr:MupG family TIM beta-alpha barrel fold protein [Virgibacillus sp. LDC-1]
MIGISVYLGNGLISDQAPYIRKMKECGFQSIFTSLHIPEDDHSIYRKQLYDLGLLAKELEMELMADISPASLQTLGYDWSNAERLLDWGLTGLRIDYGVAEENIVRLSKKMKIALNASTITPKLIDELKQKGLVVENVEAWHNYYPRPETGLGWTDFQNRNSWLKDEGVAIMAFIPGDHTLRGPLYNTLPTLEAHRNASPFSSFLELKNRGKVEKIIIGDIEISTDSLKQFQAYREGEILLRAEPVKLKDKSIIQKVAGVHTNRSDNARDCIRSVESRHYASIGKESIKPENCIERPRGTITIDNENYRRYQGELQITLSNLPADEKVNVIGRVIEDDLRVLQWVSGDQKFRIQWMEG